MDVSAAPAVRPAHVPTAGAWPLRIALLALIALGLAWELWLAPTGRGTWAVKVLPLAACLPGVWRGRLFTVRALALLVWLYVLEAAVRATTERGTGALLAVLQLALSIAVFVACVVHVRARMRARAGSPTRNASPLTAPADSAR